MTLHYWQKIIFKPATVGLWMLPLLYGMLHLYATAHNPGITFDSRHYLAAARHFASTGTLAGSEGDAYYEYAPLYPLMLSLAKEKMLLWATWLNRLSVMMSILIMLVLARKYIIHPYLWWLYGCSLVFSTPLLLIGSFVWTEPFFLLLLTLQFWLWLRYLKGGNNISFILACLTACLLCLQRNAGVYFLIFTFFWLVVYHQEKFFKAVAYLCIGGTGFIYWQLRAYMVSDTSHNVALQPFAQHFATNFYHHLEALSLWFLPPFDPALIIPVAFISWLLLGYYAHRYIASEKRLLLYGVAFVLAGYVVFLSGMWWEISVEDAERFTAVIYPVGMLGVFSAADSLSGVFSKRKKLLAAVMISIWLVYPVFRSVKNVVFWHRQLSAYQIKARPKACLKTTKQLNLTYSNMLYRIEINTAANRAVFGFRFLLYHT